MSRIHGSILLWALALSGVVTGRAALAHGTPEEVYYPLPFLTLRAKAQLSTPAWNQEYQTGADVSVTSHDDHYVKLTGQDGNRVVDFLMVHVLDNNEPGLQNKDEQTQFTATITNGSWLRKANEHGVSSTVSPADGQHQIEAQSFLYYPNKQNPSGLVGTEHRHDFYVGQ